MTVTDQVDAAEYRLVIDGEEVVGGGGGYDVINPSTEGLVGAAPEASLDDVRAAIAAANSAAPAWAALPAAQRAELLKAWARKLDEARQWLVPLLAAEMGGTADGSAGKTLDVAINAFNSFASYSSDDLGESFTPRPAIGGGLLHGEVIRKPLGVVAIISAYNAPLVNISTMAGPALLTGNTVVIKPAPQDPLAVLEVVRLATEAGFPPGVVNVVNALDPDIGRELVANPGVHAIGFTGSPGVGVQIAESAAHRLKPVLLELGGKGACVVLDDADLDKAVAVLSLTWKFHSGQICGAPTRAIVHRSVHDELVRRLVAVAESLKIGPSDDPTTVVGPVISAAHRDRIESYIASAVDEGGTIEVGGTRPEIAQGFYAAPTLITGCNPGMRVVREEIFGPVISVLVFDSVDEAVELANDSDFGLVNYVISENTSLAYDIANRLESGNVNINSFQGGGNGIEEMPFGGRKFSGFGRKGGRYALEAFTVPLGITLAS